MDDNELIAEFVGLKRHHKEKHLFWIPINDSWNSKEHLQYHREWNWLMPVVQKIYRMYDEFDFQSIRDENIFLEVLDNPVKYPISDTYRKVVEFIKWHNQQPK